LGGRGAYALAGVTAISFPGLALIGHLLLGTPAVDGRYEIYLAVLLTVVMFVAAALVDVSMRALGSVVVSSLASERRGAELVRHAPDGIMALEKDGTITSANPAAERLLDAKEEELLGTSVVAALRTRLVMPAMSDLSPRQLLESGEPIALEFSAGTGSVVVGATTTLFQRRDGSEGLQLTLHDATGRVRAHEHECEAQARLEETNRLDSVARLAGGVAHDFNNHLTVIGGSAEMLLSEVAADTEGVALSILEAKTRAANLTTGLLTYARKQMISPSQLVIHQVVAECEPLLKSLVGDKIRLEILTDATPPVMADRHQIEQCLVNLLANAKDALGTGGVARIYTAGPGAVSQSPSGKAQIVPEGFVEIRVEDDGSGMDEVTMRQAFEPFFTTSLFGERTGLGLSMVQGVVAQNGGRVVVESRMGVGTCVRIRRPLFDPS